MIISAQANADRQANELFRMCMEARGYTPREVSDEDFERTKDNPIKSRKYISTDYISTEYNVYQDATSASRLLGTITKFDIEEVLANDGAYAKVKTKKDGLIGWVRKESVK